MDRTKRIRKPLRATLTRTIHEVEAELLKEDPSNDLLEDRMFKIQDLRRRVKDCDNEILDLLLMDEETEEQYDAEFNASEEIQDKIRAILNLITKKLYPLVPPPNEDDRGSNNTSASSAHTVVSNNTAAGGKKRTFKLPKIEMQKFSGDVREWLSWWAMFEKIHTDDELHESDKFQYLVQATVEGSRARRIVDGYPRTSENYPKVIAAFNERFGDKTLLTEIYVRQLAGLVIANANRSNKNSSLSRMYDDLEANLRALETLGVTSDQSAAFLYPLVESSLPEDLVKIWQRSPLAGYEDDRDIAVTDRLKSLMKFLKREVKGAERLSLVSSGIDAPSKDKRRPAERKTSTSEVPTAAGLFAVESKCIFCDKSHDSKDCGRGLTMSLQEKKAKVDHKKVCFGCLKAGHGIKKCRQFVRCIICDKKHYAILCPELSKIRSNTSASPAGGQETGQQSNLPQSSSSLAAQSSSGSVVLQTLRVKIHGPNGSRVVRALIDTGSQRSYVLSSIAEHLGMETLSQTQLSHSVFGGAVTKSQVHNNFRVSVGPMEGGQPISLDLLSHPKICNPIATLQRGDWMKELKRNNVWLNDFGEGTADIEMLLGADSCALIFTGPVRKLNDKLTAVKTSLGWTLMGVIEGQDGSSIGLTVINSCLDSTEVEKLWRLDTIGILDPVDVVTQKEKDERAEEFFRRTVTRDADGRYVVSLPWLEGQKELLPSNKFVAEKRLKNATNKLNSVRGYETYKNIFMDWVKEGIVKVAVALEDLGHFLPHRPVFKPESLTTPVRPVFDASCKVGNHPSLNDCLERGPNLLELIPSILLRFRRKKIGASSDIRKAYQMITVKEEDQKFMKYLWWNDKGEIQVLQHCRMIFGMNCSAYLLGAVIKYHLEQVTGPEKAVAQEFLGSLYVDNFVGSFDSIEEYENFKTISIRLLLGAKMELRQWQFTSGEASRVGQTSSVRCGLDSARSVSMDKASVSILGLLWNRQEDTLQCVVPDKSEPETIITKRVILSAVAKLFDPIGFTSPAVLLPKVMLQDAWISKVGWDVELPEEIKKKFSRWTEELGSLGSIKIPRHAFSNRDSKNKQIHLFCDASQYAYAAAIFLRMGEGEEVQIKLLAAKSRVSPLKRPTIPRLELLGCLIGARLLRKTLQSLQPEEFKIFCWSDSSTALAWIRKRSDWGLFVSNRTKEINELVSIDCWRHIPGEFNPADLPSRGCNPAQLLQSRWWEGPSWLLGAEQEWPTSTEVPNEEDILVEMKKGKTIALTTTTADFGWYCNRFSSYLKTVRVVAWIRRFINQARRLVPQNGELTAHEFSAAEMTLFRLVQRESFTVEKDSVEGVRVQVGEDGLIRVHSKLTNRQDTGDFRNPVLLPSKHPLTEMLIRYTHSSCCHGGVQIVMTKLRESVWILKSRQSVKSILAKCVVCRRYSTKAPAVPISSLPEDRISAERAFEVTGIDLAGPLFLKDKSKGWVVLFTCAVFRCIHLEVVTSLSTEAFLLALQKFVTRRGRPRVIYTDNGTNFRGANNLFAAIDWKRVHRETMTKKILWKFNPPTASWWGGFWERLIRSTKDLLKKMLGHNKLNLFQLESLLCEIEGVLNSRPLTYVSEDPSDLVPLTPEMFLTLQQRVEFPESECIDGAALRKTYKEMKKMREEIQSRFRNEYLSQLIHRGKMSKPEQFFVGDIVLVGSDQHKRFSWPMGRITELIPGADGKTRVAKVKVRDGVLTRPLQRLFPMEVRATQVPVTAEVIEEAIRAHAEDTEQEDIVTTRSGRQVRKPMRLGIVH